VDRVAQKKAGVYRIREFATLAGVTVRGLNTMWNDKANWPAEERARFHIDPRVQEFIVKAMKSGDTKR